MIFKSFLNEIFQLFFYTLNSLIIFLEINSKNYYFIGLKIVLRIVEHSIT